jgi:hydroxypyruvate isomerase
MFYSCVNFAATAQLASTVAIFDLFYRDSGVPMSLSNKTPSEQSMPDAFHPMSRRTALSALAAMAGVVATGGLHATAAPAAGRLKQSVCRWPYGRTPLPDFCRRLRQIGFSGVDLLYPEEWSIARDAGMTVSMGYASRREKFIATGFNDPVNHAMLLGELETAIPLAASAQVPNVIAMFGNRVSGINDDAAIANCIAGLAKIAPLAEKQGVTVCVELLNSKVDHPGYQGDHTAFGAAVMQGVNSPRVKLLYDIYHMQIMEGDVIRTVRNNINWIGHFHTGGVPGRHEINETQELNYHAIAVALADLNYQGYVAHEFMPTRADPFVSLEEAYQLCTV